MVHIIYEKEDKKLAIQISDFLQKRNFTTSINTVTKENISQVRAVVLILNQKSNTSEKIITQYDYIFENDVPMLPFVVSDVEMSVSMQHFLNSHDWIYAYDVSKKISINDLALLLNEVLNNNSSKPEAIDKNTKKTVKNLKKDNQTKILIGVVAIFAIILLFFIFGGKNNPINSNSKPDNLIVGSWKLDKYEDNMPRSITDQADFINSIAGLKGRFLLTFNDDFTFEKLGFSQTETGNWQLDPQNMLLYMWPPGLNDQKDMLKIEKLTQDTLIMIISTQIDSLTLINTKFTLYKE